MGSKRQYIKVKVGILDPDHVNNIGPACFLYLYILNSADWETGLMRGYTDGDAADDLGLVKRTIRSWRYRLEDGGYIISQKRQYSLDLQVTNWTNPRLNWGDNQSDIQSDKSDIQSDNWMSVSSQSDIQSDIQPNNGNVTLTLSSQESLKPVKDLKGATSPTFAQESIQERDAQRLLESICGVLSQGATAYIRTVEDMISEYGREKTKAAIKSARERWVSTPRKNGNGNYSPTNYGFIDWALADLQGDEIVELDSYDKIIRDLGGIKK